MTVNVKALKDFQKVFEPVVASIPHVLEAVAASNNLQKSVDAKLAELSQAEGQIKEVFDKANDELDAMKAEAKKVEAQKEDAVKQIASDKAAARSEIRVLKEKAEATLKSKQEKITELGSILEGLEGVHRAKIDECKRNHQAVIAAQNEEIRDLEKTKAQAEKSLEKLREKLG